MFTQLKNKRFTASPIQVIFVIIITMTALSILTSLLLQREFLQWRSSNEDNQSMKYALFLEQQEKLLNSYQTINNNRKLETKVKCVGPLYNQSCLFTNLYFYNTTFVILIVNGTKLPNSEVKTNAFELWTMTPMKRVFRSYAKLERYVRYIIRPKLIPSVTLYFSQYWHYNIGHALFDGLYPAYVALILFSPRHLFPFRIFAAIEDCEDCWTEDLYGRFGGLGILKHSVLNKVSSDAWFMFDEVVMGSGAFCQRCTQPNLQLPGGVELDASRLFRDRMYQQHGLIPPIVRQKSSQYRTRKDILQAYIIDNIRYTETDKKELDDAIYEVNNYTTSFLNKRITSQTKLKWPLINVTYIYYDRIKADLNNTVKVNATSIDSRSPTYELSDNNFIAQLKVLQRMDIHLSGPGTGQMYQTFLPDGSVHVNLGGIRRPWGFEDTELGYTSYLEQHMTSGAPYIKGLYYPINERQKGIKKDYVVQLIREAGRMILNGFDIPVDPRKNLGLDGQLFVEMCEIDPKFCALVTERIEDKEFNCLELWIEDWVHENRQWNIKGFVDGGNTIVCPFNHTLLNDLRIKYGIDHSPNPEKAETVAPASD